MAGWVTIQRLGQGTYGCVDLVLDLEPSTNHDMLFAVKSCLFGDSDSLRDEFRILRFFSDCPYIVECFGERIYIDKDSNWVYNLKLEYAPGGTLEDLMTKNGGSLSERDVKRYTRMIVQGLCQLHQFSVVHCDLKPANILVFPDKKGMSKVKIADLGLAQFSSDPHSRSHSKHKFYGTPLFMSPESVRNGDIRTALDIWSLGCLVTVMLTGKCPWNVRRQEALMNVIAFGSTTPEIPKNLSKEGKDFLEKCFCRDPDKRWTAEMLLRHPFIHDDYEEYKCRDKELCGDVKSASGIEEDTGLIASSPSTLLHPSGFENQPKRRRHSTLLHPSGFENQPKRRRHSTLLPSPGFENQPKRRHSTLLHPSGFENHPKRLRVC